MKVDVDVLLEKIKLHEMATMDAPYFGWTKEFIDGYLEALARIEKNIQTLSE